MERQKDSTQKRALRFKGIQYATGEDLKTITNTQLEWSDWTEGKWLSAVDMIISLVVQVNSIVIKNRKLEC